MTNSIILILACSAFIIVVMGCFIAILLRRASKLKGHVGVFEDSIDALPYGLIFFDENSNFYAANKQAARYLSCVYMDDGELKSDLDTLNDFLDYMFDHAVDCDAGLKSALDKAAGEGFREVIRWGGEDGFCLAEVRNTSAGRTTISLRDLSDIKKNEDSFLQLNQHNFELTEAVGAATNGILIVERGGGKEFKVVFANQAFSEHMSLPSDEIIGSDICGLLQNIIGEGQESLMSALDKAEAVDLELEHEHEHEHEHNHEAKNNHDNRWFNFKLTPIEGNNGEVLLFIGVCTETTELKQREAEFFQVQKLDALGKLAAGVAHDFNNILSIIDGYSHIASKELEEGNAAKGYLDKIRIASARGADLTKKMLTFSRHKIVVESVIDLAKVIKDQEVLLKPIVDASINFSFQTHDEGLFVECTPDSITQIVMNFVVNARDAMPTGGDLIVEARRVERSLTPPAVQSELDGDSFACLSVLDTGQGIDSDTLDRIFDPFFTTKGQGKGTGLGLSMVYGLVAQVGGHIDVKTSLNQGTIFSVYFPISSKTPQKEIEGSAQDVDSINLKGYTVLIAEDEPELLSMVGNMLERLGMEVITASNGDEALLKQDDYEGEIDLLLTDVVMPELDGVKLAELFFSLRPDSKIIFMSGYPADDKLSRVALPDKSLFIAKPIQYESLAQIIFETLSGDNTSLLDSVMPHWETSDIVQKEKGS